MVLYFVTEARFGRDAAHGLAPLNPANVDSQWASYSELEDFRLVARVGNSPSPFPTSQLSIEPLPYWRGPKSMLSALPKVIGRAVRLSRRPAVFILRMPGTVSLLFAAVLLCRRKVDVYVELVGDIRSVVLSSRLPGRRVWAWLAGLLQAVVVQRASGVRYLTQVELQSAYPTRCTRVCAYADLDLEPFEGLPARDYRSDGTRILAVGSQELPYKGHDVLIRALAQIRETGATLTLVGEGAERPSLESLTSDLGLERQISFLPTMERRSLRKVLQGADVFAMPSRSEGLGRALIEAMSCGLPAVATRVGGMRELLSDDYLVEPEDDSELARKLASLITSPEQRRSAGVRNREFIDQYLAKQRAEKARWFRWLGESLQNQSGSRGRR